MIVITNTTLSTREYDIDIINNLTVTLVIRDNYATYKNEDNYSVFKTRNRTQMLYLRKSSTS